MPVSATPFYDREAPAVSSPARADGLSPSALGGRLMMRRRVMMGGGAVWDDGDDRVGRNSQREEADQEMCETVRIEDDLWIGEKRRRREGEREDNRLAVKYISLLVL